MFSPEYDGISKKIERHKNGLGMCPRCGSAHLIRRVHSDRKSYIVCESYGCDYVKQESMTDRSFSIESLLPKAN